MKNFFLPILLFVCSFLQGQDVEFLNIVNQYRQKNGRAPLQYSTEMTSFAQNLSTQQFNSDSVFHSTNNERKVANIPFEIVTGGSYTLKPNNLTELQKYFQDFDSFLKKYFGFGWTCPKNEVEILRMAKYLSIYDFHNSPSHKENLLNSHTFVGLGFVCVTDKVFPNGTIKIRCYTSIVFR